MEQLLEYVMTEIVDPSPGSDLFEVSESGDVVLRHDGSSPAVMRERIDSLVRTMLEVASDDPLPPVEHTIAAGMYMRKLFIPKGMLLAGKIHKVPCMNIVASGDITVLTEFGCRRVQSGFTGASPAGLQKIGYAHEDTIFINVFCTTLAGLEEIENEIAGTDHITDPGGEDKGLLCL